MWSKLWDAFRHVAAIQKLLDLIGLWKIVSLGIAVLAAIAMGVWAWLAELRAPVIATICVVVLAAVMAAMNFGFNFYEKWKAKNPEAHWRVPLPLALVCGIVAILAALGWGSRFYLFQRSARQQDSVPSVVQKLARQWVESHPNSPTFVKDGEYASPEELGWINTRLMIDGMAPIPIPASVHPAPITAFKEDTVAMELLPAQEN